MIDQKEFVLSFTPNHIKDTQNRFGFGFFLCIALDSANPRKKQVSLRQNVWKI